MHPQALAPTAPAVTDCESPVFDFAATLARLGGSESLFSDLARFFIEDSGTLLVRLRDAMESRDQRAAEMAVHGLKGLIANFGAARAMLAAAQAEQAARTGKLEELARIMPRLEATVRELRGALSLAIEKLADGDGSASK